MKLIATCVLALQAAVLIHGQKWTIHDSCATDAGLRDAVLKAMASVKSRSANAAEQLDKSKTDKKGLVRLSTKHLLGDQNYDAQVDKAKELLNKLAEAEGPIGPPPSDDRPLEGYMHSNEWKDLFKLPKDQKNMVKEDWDAITTYKHFVIYCAPDTGTQDNGYGNKVPWDFARDAQIDLKKSRLIKFKDEDQNNAWDDPKQQAAAVTVVDEGFVADRHGNPIAERRNVPETIVLHPLWLRQIKDKGYNELTQERINTVSKPPAFPSFKKKGMTPADSLLYSLEGTLQHEVFHLSAFGKLKDLQENAYGWRNCITGQDLSNPETLAYLITVADLADKSKLEFKADGRIKKK